MENESLIYFWLSLSGAHSKKMNKLLEIYKPAEIWENFDDVGFEKFLGAKIYSDLKKYKNKDYLERCIASLDKMKISFLARSDKDFPERLNQKEVDPPVGLFYKGDIKLLNTDCIAIVGTRNCSHYGKEMAENIAGGLVLGDFTVVSGLASGVDAYSHAATLSSGGKTVAVLGSGLNKMSPMANYNLFLKICEKGLVVSEYLPNEEGTKYSFPERNRIISGLSMGVVVVEAGLKSGSLITADFANEQGREIFAVPGNVTNPKSIGTNELIRSGATLITGGNHVCEYFEHKIHKTVKKKQSIQLDIFEQKIYNLLQNGEMSVDEMINLLGVNINELFDVLSKLELAELIKKRHSNIFGIV